MLLLWKKYEAHHQVMNGIFITLPSAEESEDTEVEGKKTFELCLPHFRKAKSLHVAYWLAISEHVHRQVLSCL